MVLRFLLLLLLAAPVLAGEWITRFETSDGLETPRYQETVEYCRSLAEASPRLRYTTFGVSPQGRPLPLLIADRQGNFTPQTVRASGNAILLVQACIHAGESCGKDAGLMLLRDLTVTGLWPELLDKVTILFIPIFNVDGHERFGPYGRANQNGPLEMGWRTNAQNLNLNRDYIKADTPEMRQWLALWTKWLPDFFIDVHSTDGADYQYTVTYSLETHGNLDQGLTAWIDDYYLPSIKASMAISDFPIMQYCSFRRWHDPRSGLRSWAAAPRFSQGYAAVQNRPGLLIETHMLKPYKTRVEGAYIMLLHTLELLNRDAGRLRNLNAAADRRSASAEFRSQPFPLSFKSDGDSLMIDFLGVQYDEVQSEITGGAWMKYHPDQPETFQVPVFDSLIPESSAQLPAAYLIPPQWTEVIERLQAHGVRIRRLSAPATLETRGLKFHDARWSESPYEGRQTVVAQQDETVETRTWPAGTALVDMNQRTARVAAHLLEPQGPDSFVSWGFFAPVFNRVEYIESYVIEAMALRMLADDPELAAELETAKEADADFAADPWAIRDWLYQRTPYYDAQHNVYPVGRVFDQSVVESIPVVDR